LFPLKETISLLNPNSASFKPRLSERVQEMPLILFPPKAWFPPQKVKPKFVPFGNPRTFLGTGKKWVNLKTWPKILKSEQLRRTPSYLNSPINLP